MSNDIKNNTPDDGGPAFPPMHDPETHASGMSLRDWFAGRALAGLLAHSSDRADDVDAFLAYNLADAMLKARKGDGT